MTEQKSLVSVPPSRLDDQYIRGKLDTLARGMARQERTEAERTGAQKNTSRMVGFFGTFITAGALGLFGWVWQTAAQTQRHEALIDRTIERAAEHDPSPPGHEELELAIRNNERLVEASDSVTKQINVRLDRIESEGSDRHREVLEELRRLRTSRR